MDFINIIGTLFDNSIEHVVAFAKQIKDQRLNKNQQDINEDLYNKIQIIIQSIENSVPISVEYPDVWFIPSNSELNVSDIESYIQNEQPLNNSHSYSKTFNTTNYYVIVGEQHSLTRVTNNSNFEYTSQFNLEDSLDGYKVFHYNRVIGAPVTWTFTIN